MVSTTLKTFNIYRRWFLQFLKETRVLVVLECNAFINVSLYSSLNIVYLEKEVYIINKAWRAKKILNIHNKRIMKKIQDLQVWKSWTVRQNGFYSCVDIRHLCKFFSTANAYLRRLENIYCLFLQLCTCWILIENCFHSYGVCFLQ